MTVTSYLAAAPVVRRVRGYFAAVNRAAGVPVLFDAAEMGGFALDAPPLPWVSLGWIGDFVRKPGSRTAAVMTGVPAAALQQVRETVDAQVSLRFLSWTKLTMALGTGSQHMNLLAPAGAAAAVQVAGSTASFVGLLPADAARFTAGQMVAVDVDYTGQLGFVGSPVSGAYVKSALTNVDYVRRVTFNVALVASVTSAGANAGLTLAEPLPAGLPVSGMKAQALLGFVDREGGSFLQEWSALFVMEGAQGERIFFHYPRLQALGGAEESSVALDAKQRGTLERVMLGGTFRALPVTDPLDGERVVCYRSFLPALGALV
jgi:hypothetical protein